MSSRFIWDEDDMKGVTRFKPTAEELEYHTDHTPETAWDDCPLCWVGMTAERFVRHQLDGVRTVTTLAKDDTSYLVGIAYEDGTHRRAIVYPPAGNAETWDLELEDEERPATTWNNYGNPDGCLPPTAKGDE